MKKRFVSVFVLAIITVLDGLMNLYSVLGSDSSRRKFSSGGVIHISRSMIVLIGFALIVSSINIYKRKKRAFRIVLSLVCLSIPFHLVKGLDYREALLSVAVAAALMAARKSFTVKSSAPDLQLALARVTIAAMVAVGYGVAGFWLLHRRDFGINFRLPDAIRSTLLFISFMGDSRIVPHTAYAQWFIDSLYLITFAALGYASLALFRPVICHFGNLPQEREMASEIVARSGSSAIDYFKLWSDKSYFFSPSRRSFLAYRVSGNFAVTLGDPVGPVEEMEVTIRRFIDFCQENDWKVAFHQTRPDSLDIYRKLGFKKLKIGDEAIVDLTRFSLEGKAMKKLRHRVNRMEKQGISTILFEPPISDEVFAQVKEISDEWLRMPGRRERGFTLGQFKPEYIRSTPIFAAADSDGRLLAFVNIIPSYCKGESSTDLMRHRESVPNGIMDYLFIKLFLMNRDQGFERFNLGMAPMAGFQEKEEASLQEKSVHYFFHHMNFVFNFTGLRQYKSKFADLWEPRYIIYRNALDLPRLAIAFTRITEIHKREVEYA